MSLANPLALMGLVALAVPVIVHLLGRRRARPQPFPSLRFLTASRLEPTRRTRLNDILLLAVRLCIVAAAVIALSQPIIDATDRDMVSARELGRILARAIIVDTSASMRRLTSAGVPAMTMALREALALAGDATRSTLIKTAKPSNALAGATQWLGMQLGRREVVIVSDFQLGAVDSLDLRHIASGIGVRLVQIDVAATSALPSIQLGNRAGRISLTGDQTAVNWSATSSRATTPGPVVYTGAAEGARTEAAQKAAHVFYSPIVADSSHPVAVIYMEYERRVELSARAEPIDRPWMGDVMARLHATPSLLAAAAGGAALADQPVDSARFSVVVRDSARRPLILASRGDVGGRTGLHLWVLADAGSLTSAALMAALPAALSNAPPSSELEPNRLPAGTLSRWERPAASSVLSDDRRDQSDGRWFWLIALALLGVESYIRRDDENSAPGAAHGDVNDTRRVA